jgi:cysteinyl-tRNA synthetase
VWLDILRRVWESAAGAYATPLFVVNITDVDDKILMAAAAESSSPLGLARRYEQEFWNDWDALNCLRPHVVTRVSEFVDSDIVPYIGRLMESGMAYEVEQMGVYFDVGVYEDKMHIFNSRYGKLAPLAQAADFFNSSTSSSSSSVGEQPRRGGAKRDPRDFALWKRRKDGEIMYWSSPWGEGRPGWHIECSAMIEAVQQRFGDDIQFAVHAGGVDLKFPHHTNEIAQAEAYHVDTLVSGTEWIPHWIHTGHLHIDGLKMSKSLKNFVTIQDMLSEGYSETSLAASPADDFRLWCLGMSGSYRGPATYSKDRLRQAKRTREKLVQFLVQAGIWLSSARSLSSSSSAELFAGQPPTQKWTDLDRALLTCAKDETARGMRGIMTDLDGATLVAAMARIADEGLAYLTRAPATGSGGEAVRAAVDSLRTLLSRVGFSDVTCRAGLAEAQQYIPAMGVDHGDNSNDFGLLHPERSVGGSQQPRALVEELVRFRSAVRELTLQGLRSGSAGDDSSSLHDAILKKCDALRDVVLPSMGVELMDGKAEAPEGEWHEKGGSVWRVCLPRSLDGEDNGEGGPAILGGTSTRVAPDKVNISSNTPATTTMIAVNDYFRVGPYQGQFSSYDATGFPTLMTDGSKLSNRLRNKLVKKREKHISRSGEHVKTRGGVNG